MAKKTAAPAKAPGRPRRYTKKLATEICRRIAEGESLRRICAGAGMPAMSTVMLWALDDVGGFSEQYARARELQADTFVDEIVDTADGATNKSNAPAIKVRVEARQWAAAKQRPKKYGATATIAHAGEGGGPIRIVIDGDDAKL